VPSQRQVLGLHTGLMVREVHDASRPEDVTDLLRMISWLGAQGVRARDAYLGGYARGVDPSRTAVTRLELFARALLADEPAGGPVAAEYLVTVVRVAEPLPPAGSAEVLGALARRRVPAAWLAPDELVLLTTGDDLGHLRTAVAAAGQPARAGSAPGRPGRLAETLRWAREVALAAPAADRPARLHTVADLFVEMSVARVPRIDAWLGGFSRALAAGPDLLATLRAYYENDMNRGAAAAALNIHPRTLDYRLRRVRETTGVDPASARGVRLLSAAVARAGLRELTNVDGEFSVPDEDRTGRASGD
jgi:PucR-like helix-turn-helix protein